MISESIGDVLVSPPRLFSTRRIPTRPQTPPRRPTLHHDSRSPRRGPQTPQGVRLSPSRRRPSLRSVGRLSQLRRAGLPHLHRIGGRRLLARLGRALLRLVPPHSVPSSRRGQPVAARCLVLFAVAGMRRSGAGESGGAAVGARATAVDDDGRRCRGAARGRRNDEPAADGPGGRLAGPTTVRAARAGGDRRRRRDDRRSVVLLLSLRLWMALRSAAVGAPEHAGAPGDPTRGACDGR